MKMKTKLKTRVQCTLYINRSTIKINYIICCQDATRNAFKKERKEEKKAMQTALEVEFSFCALRAVQNRTNRQSTMHFQLN